EASCPASVRAPAAATGHDEGRGPRAMCGPTRPTPARRRARGRGGPGPREARVSGIASAPAISTVHDDRRGPMSICGRTRPAPAPAASHTLPRLLVRDVARDHFVHGLPRVPDAFLAHREIDGRHALVGGHLLDFLARHVTHEAR